MELVSAEARLPESKKRFVDGVDVVFFPFYEVFDDDVRLAAVRQRIACAPDKVFGFVKVQFQRNRKGKRRSLARLIVWRVPYF